MDKKEQIYWLPKANYGRQKSWLITAHSSFLVALFVNEYKIALTNFYFCLLFCFKMIATTVLLAFLMYFSVFFCRFVFASNVKHSKIIFKTKSTVDSVKNIFMDIN